MNVAVFYVWVPGDEFALHTERFIESYEKHDPGVEHELFVLAKCDVLPSRLPDIKATFVAVGEEGYDVGPFRRMAEPFSDDYDRLVLLGSYSRILCDGWLAMLVQGGPLASATGSWEIRPHLRTNALSVAPKILSMMPKVETRKDCLDFEFGPRNIYRTAMDAGVEGVVVGKRGVYRHRDWRLSNTFRVGEQEDLLVADKRTDDFATADPDRREMLRRLAWG